MGLIQTDAWFCQLLLLLDWGLAWPSWRTLTLMMTVLVGSDLLVCCLAWARFDYSAIKWSTVPSFVAVYSIYLQRSLLTFVTPLYPYPASVFDNDNGYICSIFIQSFFGEGQGSICIMFFPIVFQENLNVSKCESRGAFHMFPNIFPSFPCFTGSSKCFNVWVEERSKCCPHEKTQLYTRYHGELETF